MPVNQVRGVLEFKNFEGGINTVSSALELADNEFADSNNVRLDRRGGLATRKGYLEYNKFNTGNAVVALGQLILSSTWHELMIEGSVAHGREKTGAFSDVTGAHVITSGKNNKYVIVQYDNNLIGTNGIDRGFLWDATGNLANIGNAITGGTDTMDLFSIAVVHDNQVIIGNVTATIASTSTVLPSRLWPAAAGTKDEWVAISDTGVIDVDKGNGGDITALVSVLGYLVVFKSNGLYRIENYGTSTQFVRKIAPVGCIGRRAINIVGPLVFFVDEEGDMWAYDSRGDSEDSILNVSEGKLGPRTINAIDKTRLQFSELTHWRDRNELHLLVTEGPLGQHNKVWAFKPSSGGFVPFEYATDFNIFAEFKKTDDAFVVIGGNYNGDVFRHDLGDTDDGVNIDAFFLTRHLDMNAPDVIKMFKRLGIYTTSTEDLTITLEQRLDFETEGRVSTILVDAV